jgi:hypothetical protein
MSSSFLHLEGGGKPPLYGRLPVLLYNFSLSFISNKFNGRLGRGAYLFLHLVTYVIYITVTLALTPKGTVTILLSAVVVKRTQIGYHHTQIGYCPPCPQPPTYYTILFAQCQP